MGWEFSQQLSMHFISSSWGTLWLILSKIQAFNKFMHDNVMCSALIREKKWYSGHV